MECTLNVQFKYLFMKMGVLKKNQYSGNYCYKSYLKVQREPDRVSCLHNHETFHFEVCELWPHYNDKIRAENCFRINIECYYTVNSYAFNVLWSINKTYYQRFNELEIQVLLPYNRICMRPQYPSPIWIISESYGSVIMMSAWNIKV